MKGPRSKTAYSDFLREEETLAAEKREQELAPIRAAQQELQENARALAKAERELAAHSLLNQPNNPELARRAKKANYEIYANRKVDEIRIDLRNALAQAKLNIEQKGYTLHEPINEKLSHVVSLNREIDFCAVESFDALLAYGVEVGAFTDHDITVPVTKPVAQPAPEPEEKTQAELLADMETQSDTREGTRAARKLAFEALLKEAQPIFNEFRNHMVTVWGLKMTKEQEDACVAFCVKTNAGFNARGFDLARVHVLHCLTEDEKLAQAVENTDQPLADYGVRQDFKSRHRQIHGQNVTVW